MKFTALDDRLHNYLLSVSLREPPVLSALREETAHHVMSNMQIAPEQGQFMARITLSLLPISDGLTLAHKR